MTTPTVYIPPVRGSSDWAGGAAPAGGSHTGTSTILMADASTYAVAHSRAEVLRKRDLHAAAPPGPHASAWVAFDQPGSAQPIILDALQIVSVT